MGNRYTADTIKKLDFFEAVRKAPGMYIGSKDSDGLHHLVKEVISNSIDEYLNGSCTEIEVMMNNSEHTIAISDNGRGIPIERSPQNKSPLEMCFTEEHAGGKFLNETGESGYNSAGGMHGLGVKCVNALSDYLLVVSCRDGWQETIRFENGKVVKHDYIEADPNTHGTFVEFKPSLEYLETVDFDENRIKTMLQEFSFLCSGLTFKYNGKEQWCSKNGLKDYLTYLQGDSKLISKPYVFTTQLDTYQLEAAFCWTEGYSSKFKLYTNNIPQLKGTHLTGFKTALTSTMNAFAKSKGWLKAKETNLTGANLEEGLILILNFKMIDPVFKGQNKEELSSSEGRTYVQKFAAEELKKLFAANEKDIKRVFAKAVAARKAAAAAKKARDAARKPKEKGLKAKMQLSDKFIDCTSNNPNEKRLFILEGVSAGAAAIEARNPQTDCIYLLRGKILSPRKTTVDKLLDNQEMSDLIRVIGGGFGKDFDVKHMNFDKVVIFSDSDADGDQICLLLMGFFFTYMTDLVLSGKLYRGAAPLYTLTSPSEELYFYTDKDYRQWIKTVDNTNDYKVLRGKGVGEMESTDLHRLCFGTDNFKQLDVKDFKTADGLLDIFLGTAVEPRRKYIYENAKELGFEECDYE